MVFMFVILLWFRDYKDLLSILILFWGVGDIFSNEILFFIYLCIIIFKVIKKIELEIRFYILFFD